MRAAVCLFCIVFFAFTGLYAQEIGSIAAHCSPSVSTPKVSKLSSAGDDAVGSIFNPWLSFYGGGAFYGYMAVHCGCIDRTQWMVGAGLGAGLFSRFGVTVSYRYGGVLLGGLGYIQRHGIEAGAIVDLYIFPEESRLHSMYIKGGGSIDWIQDFRDTPVVGAYVSPGFEIRLSRCVSLVNEVHLSYFFGSSPHLLFGIGNGIRLTIH